MAIGFIGEDGAIARGAPHPLRYVEVSERRCSNTTQYTQGWLDVRWRDDLFRRRRRIWVVLEKGRLDFWRQREEERSGHFDFVLIHNGFYSLERQGDQLSLSTPGGFRDCTFRPVKTAAHFPKSPK